jgi:hypothetical protein
MSAPTHHTPTPTPEWGAQPPTPNPKPKRPIMRVVGLVIGGLLVVGVVNSAVSGDNQAQATGSQPKAAAPAPKPEPKQEPAPEPQPEPPREAEQFDAWTDEALPPLEDFIEHNQTLGALMTSDPEGVVADPSEALDLLGELQSDVTGMKAAGRCPIKSVNKPWQKMLEHAGAGYVLAEDGLQAMNPEMLTDGMDEIILAGKYMDQVTEALASEIESA